MVVLAIVKALRVLRLLMLLMMLLLLTCDGILDGRHMAVAALAVSERHDDREWGAKMSRRS